MTESIARLGIDVNANIAGFESDMKRLDREAKKAAAKLEKEFAQAGKLIGGAFVAGTAALALGINSAIEKMDKLNDASKRLGVSTEFLSAMGYAAQQSGSSIETLQRGMGKFSRTFAEAAQGGGQAAEVFAAMGVSLRDTNGEIRSSEDVFKDVAGAMAGYKDGAAKIEIATKLFGKAGIELIPTLNEGKEGLAALTNEAASFGAVVGTDAAESAAQFKDNLDKLKTQFDGIFIALANQVLPTLTTLSGLVVENGKGAADSTSQFEGLGIVFEKVAGAAVIVKNVFDTVGRGLVAIGVTIGETVGVISDGVQDLGGIGVGFAKGGFIGAVKAAAQGAQDDAQIMADAAASIKNAWAFVADGVSEDVADVTAAFDKLREPAKSTGEAVAKSGNEAKKSTPNFRDFAKSQKDAEKAIKDAAKAAQEAKKEWLDFRNATKGAFDGLKAQLDPLEALKQEYEKQKNVIREYIRINLDNIEALTDANKQIQLLEANYNKEKKAIESVLTPAEKLIEALGFEISLIDKGVNERRKAILSRELEGKATQKQIEKIIELENVLKREDGLRQQYAEIAQFAGQALFDALSEAGKGGADAFGKSLGNAIKSYFGTKSNNLLSEALENIANGGGLGGRGSNGLSNGANGLLAIGGQIGGSLFGNENRAVSAAGGALQGAAYGATFGPIGAAVGAIIGAIAGAIGSQRSELEVSSTARGVNRAGRVEGTATSQLGSIFVGKEDFDFDSQAFANQIAQFDNNLASILSATELNQARAALANFDVYQSGERNVKPEEIIAARLSAVIQAVEPQWMGFLNSIQSLEDRVKQFTALRALREQVGTLDDAIAQLDPNLIAQIRFQMSNLNEAVANTGDAFEAALDGTDAAAIAESASQLQQAIVRRYQAEIDMVRNIQVSIEQAQDAARQFGIDIAARLRDVGASVSVADTIGADLGTLQAAVGTARNTEQAIANLNRFVSTVDQWLSESRAEIEQWAAQARARVESLLSGLDGEQNAIMTAAQARANAANAAGQAAAQAAQAANQSQIQALQEQLQIAQSWVSVLNQAQAALDAMTFGAANPLDAFARQDALANRIDAVRAQLGSAAGADRSQLAGELIQLLNQQLGGAGDLFQRPSAEYLDVFNNTAREISTLRDMASSEADNALALQEQLNALQGQTFEATVGVSDTLSYLSSEEQARLEEIESERAALQQELIDIEQEAQDRLAEINEQARAYYEWAQTTGAELAETRQNELLEALNAITGGLDGDSFIALRMDQAATALADIRDSITDFLSRIASGDPVGTVRPVTPPINPREGGLGDGNVIPFTANITVNGGGNPQEIGNAVRDAINQSIPQLASKLRQEARYA